MITMQNKLVITQLATGGMAMLGAVFASRFIDNRTRAKSNRFDVGSISMGKF